jgi:glycosyltransferase involved in cell wall biosynthesis
VGRDAPEKGLDVLLAAWRSRAASGDVLALAGPARAAADGVTALGSLDARQLRAVYAASDVLVVPSRATRTFREPWGLVVNEAMNAGLTVIASDAVGAAAGGLVRDGDTGLVVRADDPRALAEGLARLAGDAPLRAQLGASGRRAVQAYDHAAWAGGFSEALASLGCSAADARATAGAPRARW